MVKMSRKVFTVTAERSGRWWTLVCDEVRAVSQVRGLSEVDEEMRKMLADIAGVPADSFDIDVQVIAPEDI